MLKGLTQKEVSERVAQGKINKTKRIKEIKTTPIKTKRKIPGRTAIKTAVKIGRIQKTKKTNKP